MHKLSIEYTVDSSLFQLQKLISEHSSDSFVFLLFFDFNDRLLQVSL